MIYNIYLRNKHKNKRMKEWNEKKRKKRKGSTDDKPSSPDLGLWFFRLVFFPPFFWMFCFFSPSWFFGFFIITIIFCFLLFCFLFCSCSLCVSDDTTCFRSATRNYPEKLTCQPRLHLLCSADTCWRKATDVDCPRTSPVWGSQPPLSLQEVGFSPLLPQHLPNARLFSSPPTPLFLFWCSTREICSVTGLQSLGWKEVANCWSETFTLGNFCPRRWTQPGGGGCGEGDGCSGSTVFHESRAHSHQKPARSNSKLSVEPRQYWGASSRDFLNLLFLPTTFSFSFAPFFYIYMYICVYIYL